MPKPFVVEQPNSVWWSVEERGCFFVVDCLPPRLKGVGYQRLGFQGPLYIATLHDIEQLNLA